MKNINWDGVQEASEYKRLPAGGYVVGILRVTDMPDKEYLSIEYDIAEGNFKNFYRQQAEAHPDWRWGGVLIRSYKPKAQPFFKQFLTCLKKSNDGFTFNNDERTLVRKKVGLVLAEEEYEKSDGSIGTRLYAAQVRSIDAIRGGDFEVPAKKLLDHVPQAAGGSNDFAEITDADDLPF